MYTDVATSSLRVFPQFTTLFRPGGMMSKYVKRHTRTEEYFVLTDAGAELYQKVIHLKRDYDHCIHHYAGRTTLFAVIASFIWIILAATASMSLYFVFGVDTAHAYSLHIVSTVIVGCVLTIVPFILYKSHTHQKPRLNRKKTDIREFLEEYPGLWDAIIIIDFPSAQEIKHLLPELNILSDPNFLAQALSAA